VCECLAKGLVDKGVLNFLLFDMATHPVTDTHTKDGIVNQLIAHFTARTTTIPATALEREGTQPRVLWSMALVCTAYATSVLENALTRLGYEE